MKLLIVLCAFAIIRDVSAYPAKGHPYKSEHCIKMTPQKEKEINKIITRITDFLGDITAEFEDFDIRLVKLDIESHSEDEVEEKELQLQLTVNDCTDNIGEDKGDAHKPEESDNSGHELEKDISIEVPDKYNKNKPNDDQNIKTTSPDSTGQAANDIKGCEKCPCICNQNFETPISKELNNGNSVDTDKNDPKTSKTQADTSKNEENAAENNTAISANEQDTVQVNLSNTKTESHYDITPVDTIRFYEFGEDTDSNNSKQPEVTRIYTFSREVQPEVLNLDLSGVGGDILDLMEKRNNKPLVVYIQRNTDQNEYIFL